MPKKKKNPLDWRYCEGKQLLLRDIRDGRIPEDMDWEEAFVQRPEFDVGKTWEDAKRLFQARLKSARKTVVNTKARAITELEMLRQDRAALPPPPAVNHRGEPRWEGSAAQALLKQDVADKKHETMSRIAFYNSRLEYKAFSKTTISKHIDQEVRTNKFLKQYAERRDYY